MEKLKAEKKKMALELTMDRGEGHPGSREESILEGGKQPKMNNYLPW